MKINNQEWKTIWLNDSEEVCVIDQTLLPHKFETKKLTNYIQVADAISSMVVRGAPLIGVTGAYGLMLAMKDNPSDENLKRSLSVLNSTRPTAVNLNWALNRVFKKIKKIPPEQRVNCAKKEAEKIAYEDILMCESIGINGLKLIKEIANRKNQNSDETINILTHCNAGWLAAVNWGTALAPIYKAHREGFNIHVWVDETRPRNQGANLTAFELNEEGVPNTIIVDNAGGHLMQKGLVDAVIVGSDRTTRNGDVCNKIGTYLKALAAKDNGVPFYAALPISTIDWSIKDGLQEIPIESRSEKEITNIQGKLTDGSIESILICPEESKGFNPAFDVTPNHLVTKIITEKGVSDPNEKSLVDLYGLK